MADGLYSELASKRAEASEHSWEDEGVVPEDKQREEQCLIGRLKYKDINLSPREAAQSVLAILGTLRSVVTNLDQGGLVDLRVFASRLQSKPGQHLSEAYVKRFAKELLKFAK